MIDRYAVFSKHAHERLTECQLSLAKAAWLLYTSQEETVPTELKQAKFSRYSQQAKHYRNGTYIFTLMPMVDKFTGDDIYLVLSVFDQRMDLGAPKRKKRSY